MNSLLLDTHVWIWLNEGSPELKSKIINIIDKVTNEGQIYIAAISVWEIATLAQKKRISLKMPIEEWVNQALALPGVELLPLQPSIAIESTQLPENFHGDPADRIIVATARIHRLILCTRDARILEYSSNGLVDTLKC